MKAKDINKLYGLLDELIKSAPCKAGICKGSECEYCLKEDNVDFCTIEHIISTFPKQTKIE